MTHFLPARVEWRGESAEVRPLRWQGSGDIAALSRANCFLVVPLTVRTLRGREGFRFARSDVL